VPGGLSLSKAAVDRDPPRIDPSPSSSQTFRFAQGKQLIPRLDSQAA